MSVFWNKYNARKRGIEQRYAGQVYREVRRQYSSFLTAIKEHGYGYAKANIDRIIPIEGMAEVLKKVYRAGAWIESRYVFAYLTKDKPMQLKRMGDGQPVFGVGFDEIAQVVDDYFRIYLLNKAVFPISDTTKRHIREHLIAQVDAGVPLDEAIKNFRELALTSGDHPERVFSRLRAKTIIETESLKALNFGGMVGGYMSGVPLTDIDKVWVTCRDERVRGGRFSHRALDRNATSFYGSFFNGEQIRFPGDPQASAGNTINCRCTVFFHKKVNRPRERRSITQFLTDFFIGFTIGQQVGNFISDLVNE